HSHGKVEQPPGLLLRAQHGAEPFHDPICRERFNRSATRDHRLAEERPQRRVGEVLPGEAATWFEDDEEILALRAVDAVSRSSATGERFSPPGRALACSGCNPTGVSLPVHPAQAFSFRIL